MKLIKPSFEILEQKPKLDGVYKQIELAGRTCYKSEDKITEDSAKGFVERMVKSGHGAMLEHGTVYLFLPFDKDFYNQRIAEKYYKNKYSKSIIRNDSFCIDRNGYYVTTNYRVIIENKWTEDLKYICEPTEYHEKRITVKFTCDRGVSHEFVRHRVFSFAQESTRYCNYSKGKFNNECTFIIPEWFKNKDEISINFDMDFEDWDELKEDFGEEQGSFLGYFRLSEIGYFKSLEYLQPQQARAILPNALKTELVMTGFVSDWWGEYLVFDKQTGLLHERIHGKFPDELNNIDKDAYRVVEKGFFPLRCSQAAHPQARELAIPLKEEFTKRKLY